VSASLTWVGHSTVLVELGPARFVTDPLLRSRVAHLTRRTDGEPAPLGDLDGVLISHVHRDHLDLPSLRRLGDEVPMVVPRGGATLLRRGREGPVHELEPGGVVELAGVRIQATLAAHDARRSPISRQLPALGFVLASEDARVYFAGDTDLFPGMEALAGTLDAALLPVWGWGPGIGPGHMGPDEAAQAAALLRPRLVVPIHWGTYYPAWRGHKETGPLERPAREFEERARELAPDVEVKVLAPGERLELARV
jgi:L-ascorbate metabolism protein UlaG (beta-lactamase superfamily)